MAATLARVAEGEDVAGKTRMFTYDVTADNSYPAGGYAVSPSDVGLKFIIGVQQIAVNTAGLLYFVLYNQQTGKLVFITAGAEASGDIHTITARLRFLGQ